MAKETATPPDSGQKKAGFEIIFEFKDNLNALIHWYALYINLIAKFKLKGKDDSEEGELLQAQVKQYNDELRYSCTICYIKYKSLAPVMKIHTKAKIEEVDKLYKAIEDEFLLTPEKVYAFIEAMNLVMVSDIIQDLLRTNKAFINQIFTPNNATP